MLLCLAHSLPTKPSQFPAASTRVAAACRPAVILPGLGNNAGDYKGLASTLQSYGVPSVVADVSRLDWLRNAAGLVDANYWKGTLRPRPVLDWYLDRVVSAVSEARQISQGEAISLVGHSAGGWLARLCMEEFGTEGISLLLTLGTPHLYDFVDDGIYGIASLFLLMVKKCWMTGNLSLSLHI